MHSNGFLNNLHSIFTARKQSLGQGNIFAPVCHSVHRAGGLPRCMLGNTPLGPEAGTTSPPPGPEAATPPGPEAATPSPRSRHPPTPGTRGRHPPAQCMLGDTGNKRAVRILLKCNLVFSGFYSVSSSENVPCLIYVTFSNKVLIYYNITFTEIGCSNLIETMKEQEGVQDLLNYFNVDGNRFCLFHPSLNYGSHFSGLTKFPDFSSIFLMFFFFFNFINFSK